MEGGDDALVGKAAQGDEVALIMLYNRYFDEAARLAYTLTGRADLVEDVVQDAFVRTFRNLSKVKHQRQFKGWIRKAVLWSARTHMRRRYNLLERLLPEVRIESRDALDAIDTREALRAALAELPIPFREAIVARYFLDLSEAEAARLLGCRPGTIKSRLARAVARLQLSPQLMELAADSGKRRTEAHACQISE